jgi:hypothetical protein
LIGADEKSPPLAKGGRTNRADVAILKNLARPRRFERPTFAFGALFFKLLMFT